MKHRDFRRAERMDQYCFYVLTDHMHQELTSAHSQYLEVTRPHKHPLLDVEESLLKTSKDALLAEIRQFASDDEIQEVESFCQAVATAKTSRESKAIPRPDILGGNPPRKQVEPDERERRKIIVRWIYLLACGEVSRSDDDGVLRRFRAFSWTNWDDIDLGIKYEAACPSCHGNGTIHLSNLENPSSLSFSCTHCGHRYGPSEARELRKETSCDCARCRELKHVLLENIRGLFRDNEGATLIRYGRWRKSVADGSGAWPAQIDMLRHYELNKDNLTKDLRAILNLKPTNFEEFLDCLAMYSESIGGNPRSILDAAQKMKLIYERMNSFASSADSMAELLHSSLRMELEHRGARWDRHEITWRTAGSEKMVAALLGGSNVSDAIFVRNDSIWIDLASDNLMSPPVAAYALLFSPEGTEGFSGGALAGTIQPTDSSEYQLNPYFLPGAVKSGQLPFEPNRNQPNLFKSPPENNGAIRLATEFPDHWIVPNRLMRQIVDLDALKTHFEPKAMTYLWACEVDFAVYNEDGVIVLVEELQRGKHHNDKEWIWKDGVKRRALELSRVSFRESF